MACDISVFEYIWCLDSIKVIDPFFASSFISQAWCLFFVSVQRLVWIAIRIGLSPRFSNKTWPYFKQDSDNSYSFKHANSGNF